MDNKIKKRGRPTNEPKTGLIKFRCDDKVISRLEYCSISLSLSKSDILRMSINKLYNELSDEKNGE
ncbi:MAG: hypothetical protein ACI33I_07450 [Clostridium sp.]